MKISTRRNRITSKLEKLQEQLMDLREECPHIGHARVARSDTGNWDRSQDCYWYECRCDECGKRWTEEQ